MTFFKSIYTGILNKKKDIFIFILALTIAFVGIFGLVLMKSGSEEEMPLRPGEEYGVEYREPGEIKVEDIGNNQKRVTDTRQGYSAIVPAVWNIQKPTAVYDIFYFDDYVNGCGFSTGFVPGYTAVEALIGEEDPRDEETLTVNNYKIDNVVVNNNFVKRVTLETLETGFMQAIYLLNNNQVFGISLGVLNGNREVCSQELLQLANTVQF